MLKVVDCASCREELLTFESERWTLYPFYKKHYAPKRDFVFVYLRGKPYCAACRAAGRLCDE